jgi:hypothetical protein
MTKKGGASSPLSNLLKTFPELSSGKNALKHLVQAVQYLSSPNLAPNYPASKGEI